MSAQLALGWLAFFICLGAALAVSNVTFDRLADGSTKLGDYVQVMMPNLKWAHLFDNVKTDGSIAYWFYGFKRWAIEISQSLEMAMLATIFGFVGALIWSFPAARNLQVPGVVTWFVRRFLEICRSIPDIALALILVFAFGIGPAAGVLAISIHTTGSLGKLFSEVHENIDLRPVEGVLASGGGWIQRMRFGVVPQVLPNLVSYALLRFEYNVAASTVVGVVGAGGIGTELRKWIDLNAPQDSLAIILMIIVVIFAIDLSSERLRTQFQSGARV